MLFKTWPGTAQVNECTLLGFIFMICMNSVNVAERDTKFFGLNFICLYDLSCVIDPIVSTTSNRIFVPPISAIICINRLFACTSNNSSDTEFN